MFDWLWWCISKKGRSKKKKAKIKTGFKANSEIERSEKIVKGPTPRPVIRGGGVRAESSWQSNIESWETFVQSMHKLFKIACRYFQWCENIHNLKNLEYVWHPGLDCIYAIFNRANHFLQELPFCNFVKNTIYAI